MSGFLNLTPATNIILENPFLAKRYPGEGSVAAIIDTGYEGFLSLPDSIFRKLGLNKLDGERGKISLPNGTLSHTRGSYAILVIPHMSLELDGFIETFPGLDEIILGVDALSKMRLLLDYCTRKIRIEKCP